LGIVVALALPLLGCGCRSPTEPQDAGPEDVEAYLRTWWVPDCGDWEYREAVPMEPPDEETPLAVKWRYPPPEDPTAVSGPLAERLDGGICLRRAPMSGEILCLDRDGELLWRWDPADGPIIGGPTVLPDGTVLAIWLAETMYLWNPENPDSIGHAAHGLGQMPDYLVGDYHGPLVAAGGRFFLASLGARMTGPDDWYSVPAELHLNRICSLAGEWTWVALEPCFPQWTGGVMGDEAIFTRPCNRRYPSPPREVVGVRTDGSLEVLLPEDPPEHQRVYVLGDGKLAYSIQVGYTSGFDGGLVEPVQWCRMDRDTLVPDCVVLEDTIPPVDFVVAADGTPIGVRNATYHRSFIGDGRPTFIAAWEPDGRVRWRLDFTDAICYGSGDPCLSVPVVGADGSTLFFQRDGWLEAGTWMAQAILHRVSRDGSIHDTLTVDGFDPRAGRDYSPLLARDGTLYHLATVVESRIAGGSSTIRHQCLVAFQTPVPGLAPEDPGWPVFDRRTTRGDLWAR
jgi:hypothetical protein